jgi:hypothetical protein
MYQRSARPIRERWHTHSGGQPQRSPLGLWSLPTMLMGELYASFRQTFLTGEHVF